MVLSHGAFQNRGSGPSTQVQTPAPHVLCYCLHGVPLAALHRAPTESQALCHIWALRTFLRLGIYTPEGWWGPVSGYSVFHLCGRMCVCVIGADIGDPPLRYLGRSPTSECVSLHLLTWLLVPASGSWTAGSPAFGALKKGLALGGHDEYLGASFGYCLCGVGLTASAALLEGPGRPACQGWGEGAAFPPCPKALP